MCQNLKVRLIFEICIHGFHVAVHARTNTLTGSKEVLYDCHFSQQLLVCYRQSVLVDELERLYITDHGLFGLPHISSLEQEIPKSNYQHNEKQNIAYEFL